jgi:AraC family transcriptional regulator
MVAVHHDDPETTPEPEQRADAALVVGEAAPIPAGVVEVRIPGGRYATTIHRGSYEKLGDTWSRFMGPWLAGSGHRVGEGVTYEEYVNNPTQVDTPELITKLHLPIV